MKEKSKSKIRSDLISSGVPSSSADIICKASGLSGASAKRFIKVRI